MIGLERIAYVRLGVSDLDDAVAFATRILGLQVVERDSRQALFRSDDRHHTLSYEEGDPNVQTVGFELADAQEIAAAAGQLERTASYVHQGTARERDLRHVEDFVAFKDPTGNTIELTTRQHRSGRRYYGSRDAGITGFSHIGLRTTDAARDERFWTNVCNARVSDWIGTAPLLRINPIHHSLALFPSSFAGVQHINHQVESIDDVMRSYYFLRERGVKIVFGPGRHATSGAVFCISRDQTA